MSGTAAPTEKLTADAIAAWDRTRFQGLRDPEFVASVSFECVVGHQLDGDLFCQGWLQAATDIDLRQLLVLALVVGSEFGSLEREIGLLGVGLRVNRNVFAGGHRHSP